MAILIAIAIIIAIIAIVEVSIAILIAIAIIIAIIAMAPTITITNGVLNMKIALPSTTYYILLLSLYFYILLHTSVYYCRLILLYTTWDLGPLYILLLPTYHRTSDLSIMPLSLPPPGAGARCVVPGEVLEHQSPGASPVAVVAAAVAVVAVVARGSSSGSRSKVRGP